MSPDAGPPIEPPPPSKGEHVTTLSYLGRFWDVFLELSTLYSINFEHDGPADLKVFVFRNPGAG